MSQPENRVVTPDQDELDELHDITREEMPKLFAVYGIYRRVWTPGDPPESFLGWGMEFTEDDHAVFWFPGGEIWFTTSAVSMLERLTMIAHARLRWLDGRDDDGPIAA